MKPLLFLFLFLISVGIVSASDIIYSFDNCEEMNLSVTGDLVIDDTEYLFENCIQTSENLWNCQCNKTFDLIMNYKLNTLNNYTIIIDYIYFKEKPKGNGGSTWTQTTTIYGTGTGITGTGLVIITSPLPGDVDWLDELDKDEEVIDLDEPEQLVIVEKPKPFPYKQIITIISLTGIVFVAGMIYKYKFKKVNK